MEHFNLGWMFSAKTSPSACEEKKNSRKGDNELEKGRVRAHINQKEAETSVKAQEGNFHETVLKAEGILNTKQLQAEEKKPISRVNKTIARVKRQDSSSNYTSGVLPNGDEQVRSLRRKYTTKELEIIHRIYKKSRPSGEKEWNEYATRVYEECSKYIQNFQRRDTNALRVKCSILFSKRSYSVKRRRRRTDKDRSDSSSSPSSFESPDDTFLYAENAKVSRCSRKKNYSLVPVYENPRDALINAPPRRTRPRGHGDIVGEVFVYGDEISWGMSHDFFGRNPKTRWPLLLEERLHSKGLKIVESNMLSRTTIFNDEACGDWDFPGARPEDFNGFYHFGAAFSSHTPLWVIIMLGTHDLKERIRNVAKTTIPPVVETSDSDLDMEDSDGGVIKESKPIRKLTAKQIAENCALIGLKALKMFDGHCHRGKLSVMLVVPPRLKLVSVRVPKEKLMLSDLKTSIARSFGFDEESTRISEQLPSAFKEVCRKHHFLYAHSDLAMEDSVDGIHLTTEATTKLADAIWDAMLPSLPRPTRKPERFEVIH